MNISDVGASLAALTNPGLWKRVVVGLGGAWLIYLGIVIILASTDAAQGAVKSAVKAVA